MFKKILLGISVLPALVIMPVFAGIKVDEPLTYDEPFEAEGINDTVHGGAFWVYDGPLTFDSTAWFTGNYSSTYGGAIFTDVYGSNSSVVFNDNVWFTGNYALANGGGAIYNESDVTFNALAVFSGNYAPGGGAIGSNEGTTTIFNGDVIFSENGLNGDGAVFTQTGGAIQNGGTMIFRGTANFNYNAASNSGSAFANQGTMIFEQGLSATYNQNGSNIGAIANGLESGTTPVELYIYGGDVIISNNTATAKAGIGASTNSVIYIGAMLNSSNEIEICPVGNIKFENNVSSNGTGSAIFAHESSIETSLYADNILFNANVSQANYGGGAVFNISDMNIIGGVNTFSNNVANGTYAFAEGDKKYYYYGGGAIHNRGMSVIVDEDNTRNATLTIGRDDGTSQNIFDSNVAMQHGGAILSRSGKDSNAYIASTTINGTTLFVSNKAGVHGGAIANYGALDGLPILGQSIFTFNGDTNFQNNIAGGDGGAIYNTGDMTFNGNVSFSGNKSGATFTFDEETGAITGYTGGVANDIYNDGTITFNGDVTLDGGILGAGTLVLSNGKILNIGGACITQNTIQMNGGKIVAAIDSPDYEGGIINVGEFVGDGTIALTLGDVGTYTIFGSSVFDNTVLEGNITFESPIYNLTWNEENTIVTAERKTAEQIAADTHVSDDAANTVLNLMDSSSSSLNNLGMAVQEQLAVGNATSVEEAVRAIHPETESVTQSVSMSVQNAIANLAAGRMSLLQQSIGRSGGDMPTRNGLWVEGMYNKSKQNDSFNGYTRGIVAGIDTKLARGFMIGVGYSYAHSDISATARSTEIDSNTIFAYGQYKPTAWYMNAMLNYTMSDYNEKSDVLGVAVKSDYDVDALGAQVMTGYDFAGGITPEVGLRYMHISADEYKNSLGVKSKLGDSDYLTAVLGTKYAFDYRIARGFTLRPELRYAVKYDMVSDKSVATVTMPGLPSYVLNGARLSRLGAEFGGGLVIKYQDFSMSLNYDIEIREGYTSQTGRVRARMVF